MAICNYEFQALGWIKKTKNLVSLIYGDKYMSLLELIWTKDNKNNTHNNNI